MKRSFLLSLLSTLRTVLTMLLVTLFLPMFGYFSAEARIQLPSSIAKGMDCHCTQHYVVEKNLEFIKNLADDKDGSPHQKFLVKTSQGQSILIVSNLDLCDRIQLKAGDKLNVAGEYIWNKRGGLIHWTHFSKNRRRPDGYIQVNDKTFCQKK